MEINSNKISFGPPDDADGINTHVLDVQENALRYIARLIASRHMKEMQVLASSKSVDNQNNNSELKDD